MMIAQQSHWHIEQKGQDTHLAKRSMGVIVEAPAPTKVLSYVAMGTHPTLWKQLHNQILLSRGEQERMK